MAKIPKKVRDETREKKVQEIMELLKTKYDDVMAIKSNKLAFPILTEEYEEKGEKFQEEAYLEITIALPTGSKDEEYDPYILAEEYKQKVEETKKRLEKEKEQKEKKKIRDAERRKKTEEKRKELGLE